MKLVVAGRDLPPPSIEVFEGTLTLDRLANGLNEDAVLVGRGSSSIAAAAAAGFEKIVGLKPFGGALECGISGIFLWALAANGCPVHRKLRAVAPIKNERNRADFFHF